MKKSNKIFGIGLSRTGTTSLTKAIRILGCTAIHYPQSLSQIEKYDAATDITVAKDYEELDQLFPRSKFILTVRNESDWIASMKTHYEKYPASKRGNFVRKIRREVWGTEGFDRKIMLEVYHRHFADVKRYFQRRSEDLIILNICDGDGWEKLCPFLGKKIPNTDFPWLNAYKRK